MANKKQAKAKKSATPSIPTERKMKVSRDENMMPWFLLVAAITAVCLWPMLTNELTNWDDEYYVTNNLLLRGPDWSGIFSEPVVGNYHPLTVLTLAFNYAISGLDPFSYLLVNYALHIVNTLLVFRFIWTISNKNKFIAAFVAIIFGIHPMHVESAAWVSERKDVLYTLFFLLSLLQYWKFLLSNKRSHFWFCFLFFVLSLLSKPAAIVLPLVLLLLDYWKGRPITLKLLTEKIPFFILSVLFGIITVKIQSPTAMAGLNVFSIIDRILFACYVLMMYFVRFFYPDPLSAFHPFPDANNLPWPVLISPLFVVAMFAALWFFRKNKIVVFGILFYVFNLLLVLQIVSIGLTVVSERYTYVPYIGLAFMIGMLVSKIKILPAKSLWPIAGVFILVLGIISFHRTKIWKDSNTLWTDVIKTYPETPYPRTNRANYISKLAEGQKDKRVKDSLFRVALSDCNVALRIKPNLAAGYEKRTLIYLGLEMFDSAFADAKSLVSYDPKNKIGYDVQGTIYFRRNEPAKAMESYNKCIEVKPDDHRSYNNRGTIYLNFYKQYPQALNEFSQAIIIAESGGRATSAQIGSYYLNRSICYYRMGDITKAKQDAIIATQKGNPIPDNYKSVLQLQ